MTRQQAFILLTAYLKADQWEEFIRNYGDKIADGIRADLANLDELDRTLADPHHYGNKTH